MNWCVTIKRPNESRLAYRLCGAGNCAFISYWVVFSINYYRLQWSVQQASVRVRWHWLTVAAIVSAAWTANSWLSLDRRSATNYVWRSPRWPSTFLFPPFQAVLVHRTAISQSVAVSQLTVCSLPEVVCKWYCIVVGLVFVLIFRFCKSFSFGRC